MYRDLWIQPDLIVCDFDTKVGALIADELIIQWELNTPGMADMILHWAFPASLTLLIPRCAAECSVSHSR